MTPRLERIGKALVFIHPCEVCGNPRCTVRNRGEAPFRDRGSGRDESGTMVLP